MSNRIQPAVADGSAASPLAGFGTNTSDLDAPAVHRPDFQTRVQPWLQECFGATVAADRIERHHRFLEEALELVQSTGCTADEAHQLVDYVYGRPKGEIGQEIGGVMLTLAALCIAHDQDMQASGEAELSRVWSKIEQIRAKQAGKPKYGCTPPAIHRPVQVHTAAATHVA